jgi:Lrp/AsnC family leucine-responsive transcriptional regulator
MDVLDRKILEALQHDARRKNADLAKDLGVAPSTMLERIRRLENRGYIKGFRAIVNREKLGLSVQALVSVSLAQITTGTIRPFEKAIKEIPYVLVCYHVTGRFDYILHVMAKSLNHLGILVKEHIAAIEGVARTETFIVFSEIKNDPAYPLDEAIGENQDLPRDNRQVGAVKKRRRE